jgi:hypothetical protein
MLVRALVLHQVRQRLLQGRREQALLGLLLLNMHQETSVGMVLQRTMETTQKERLSGCQALHVRTTREATIQHDQAVTVPLNKT